MRAFVTGATGFLGSHVAEQLAARGDAVRALARPGSARSHLDSLRVEIVPGDLRAPAAWMPSLEGIDVVFHCAAVVGDWGRWTDFEAVSVGGTRAIVEAAVRGGVKRFVHLSSTAVYGLRQVRGRRVDEDAPLRGDSLRWGYYGRAKAAAERIVREAHDRGRIECTLLRPPSSTGRATEPCCHASPICFAPGDCASLAAAKPRAPSVRGRPGRRGAAGGRGADSDRARVQPGRR